MKAYQKILPLALILGSTSATFLFADDCAEARTAVKNKKAEIRSFGSDISSGDRLELRMLEVDLMRCEQGKAPLERPNIDKRFENQQERTKKRMQRVSERQASGNVSPKAQAKMEEIRTKRNERFNERQGIND
jgi:hypothetical protein